MQHNRIIQDGFHRHYRVHTPNDPPIQAASKPECFRDLVQAEQFVRTMRVPAGFWQQLASRYDTVGINPGATVEGRISRLLVQGTIKLFRVKHLDKQSGSDSAPKSFPKIKTANGQRYQLAPASVLLEKPASNVKTFISRQEAEAFVTGLGLSAEQFTSVFSTMDVSERKGVLEAAQQTDALSQALLDRAVVVLPYQQVKTPSLTGDDAVVSNQGGGKPNSLGPHDDGSGSQPRTSLSNTAPAKYTNIKSMDPTFEREDESDYDHPRWGQDTVKYLDDSELTEYELMVKNGKLVHAGGSAVGEVFDTSDAYSFASGEGSAIFIMTPEGKIYASHSQEVGAFHHSSLAQGKPVASAGEIVVENGILKEVSNGSGHYGPSQSMNDQFIGELKDRGLTDSKLSGVLRTGFDDSGKDGFIALQADREKDLILTEYIPKYWWKYE